jgi:hypothetical protein
VGKLCVHASSYPAQFFRGVPKSVFSRPSGAHPESLKGPDLCPLFIILARARSLLWIGKLKLSGIDRLIFLLENKQGIIGKIA